MRPCDDAPIRSRAHVPMRPWAVGIRCRGVPPSAVFPPREVSLNRGDNVASPGGAGSRQSRRSLECDPRRTQSRAQDDREKSKTTARKARRPREKQDGRQKKTGRPPEKDRAARMPEALEPPSFRKRLCQTNLLQALPAGASRVASVFAASLIGLKGVLNPKAQVKPVAASRFNHSLRQTSTKIWR